MEHDEALRRLGFSVTALENAGYAALRRGLLEFQRAASALEVAVVFYAGHGIEVDHRNFLVPVDARLASDLDVEYEAVPLELVQRAAGPAPGSAPPSGGPAPAIVPGAAQVRAEQLAAERVYWESVKGSADRAELRGYLERYPGGTFELLARSRRASRSSSCSSPFPSSNLATGTEPSLR